MRNRLYFMEGQIHVHVSKGPPFALQVRTPGQVAPTITIGLLEECLQVHVTSPKHALTDDIDKKVEARVAEIVEEVVFYLSKATIMLS